LISSRLEVAVELGYIRGFFDSHCHVDEISRAIVLTTDLVDLARRVAAKLRQERIQCTVKVRDGRAKLRVSTREALERWNALVGFDDGLKREKLERILSSYGS
jgi:hypothetical protein